MYKKLLYIVIFVLAIASFVVCAPMVYRQHRYSEEIDSLFKALDREIGRRPVYTADRNQQLAATFAELENVPDDTLRYAINNRLYKLLFKYDHKAIKKVLNHNVAIASRLKDPVRQAQSLIRLAYIYAHETPDHEIDLLLKDIEPSTLPDSLQFDYYNVLYYNASARRKMYDSALEEKYTALSDGYLKKLLEVAARLDPRTSLSAQRILATYDRIRIDAICELKSFLDRPEITPQSPEYAMATYQLGRLYAAEGDDENSIVYFIKSAISDIQNCLKDHGALYILARRLYNDGDLRQAYSYVQISMKDAKDILSARMLSNATDIFIIIYDAFEEMKRRETRSLFAIIALFFVLIGVAFTVSILIKRHATRLSKALLDLEEMNDKYKQSIERLTRVSEMKEKYLVQFLTLGATYIENKEQLKKRILKQVRNGSLENIEKLVDMNDFADQDLRIFYNLFDASILQIFPNFVEKINALLQPEHALRMKNPNELTLELRILAMLTLGINDTALIAQYMRASVTTVYTYRSRIRRMAKNPDDFEQEVAGIDKTQVN